MTLFSHYDPEDHPVTLADQLSKLKAGQKVKLKSGKIMYFLHATKAGLYSLLFVNEFNTEHMSFTAGGIYQSRYPGPNDIAEILPMEEPTPTAPNDTPETVTETTTTTTVDAVPAPTTMQELYEAALADLSVSDQEVVKAHIKNRLIEVQRLQTLLSKAQRELDHFMQLPVEEAVLRLTHQDRRAGMQFRAIAAPKDSEELRYGC